MLRIPEEGEASAPLMAAIQKIGFATTPEDNKRQKRRKKKMVSDAVVADSKSGKGRNSDEDAAWKWMLRTTIIWSLSFAVIAGIIFLFLRSTELELEKLEVESDGVVGETILEIPISLTAGLDKEDLVPKGALKRSDAQLLSIAEAIARRFLDATTVEEILPLVSEPDRVIGKIRSKYPDGKIIPLGLSRFSPEGKMTYEAGIATVPLLTANHVSRQMVFIEGEDGPEIDWESWAGWSEMPWEEIIENRPAEPVLVRVNSKAVAYYNFGYADENEWTSYRLLSPDSRNTLYGYAKRGSAIDEQLSTVEPDESKAVTLRICFPVAGASGAQVEITEFLADGWVFSTEGE